MPGMSGTLNVVSVSSFGGCLSVEIIFVFIINHTKYLHFQLIASIEWKQPREMSTSISNITVPEKDTTSSGATKESSAEVSPAPFKRGFQFWAIMSGLGVTSLMASLENSVVVTAGPAMVADLEMGEEYVWIANAFFVCW